MSLSVADFFIKKNGISKNNGAWRPEKKMAGEEYDITSYAN
jgi:hypothetical protein